jgi:hypothetical protein
MRFTVVLFRDEENGGYEAVVPALPNCVTQGESVEEALEMAASLVRMRLPGEDLSLVGGTEAALTATIDVEVPVRQEALLAG